MTLRDHLDKTDTHLAQKPHYRVWWHAVASWIATALLWCVGRDFVGAFWTTLGDTIYAPTDTDPDLDDRYVREIVAHELAHRYDDRRHGWRYRLSYLLSGKARARWEVRGYGMQMLTQYRERGEIPDGRPADYAETITGPAYLWAGDYDDVLADLEAIADAVRAGRVDAQRLDVRALEGIAPTP